LRPRQLPQERPLPLRLLGPGHFTIARPFLLYVKCNSGNQRYHFSSIMPLDIGDKVSLIVGLAEVIVALRQYLKCLSGFMSWHL